MNDSQGTSLELHYIRTTDGHEIDFVLADETGRGTHFNEAKVGDTQPAHLLRKTAAQQPQASAIQLVRRTPHAFDVAGVGVRPAAQWLSDLEA